MSLMAVLFLCFVALISIVPLAVILYVLCKDGYREEIAFYSFVFTLLGLIFISTAYALIA